MKYSLSWSITFLVLASVMIILFIVVIPFIIRDMYQNIKTDKDKKYKVIDSLAIASLVAFIVGLNVANYMAIHDCNRKINEQVKLISYGDNSNVFIYSSNRFNYSFKYVNNNGKSKYIKVPTHCVVNMQYTSDTIGWAYIEKEPWQNAKISLVIPQNYMTR